MLVNCFYSSLPPNIIEAVFELRLTIPSAALRRPELQCYALSVR